MQGFNDELLKNHFTLYSGYVKNANGILGLLKPYIQQSQPMDYPYQALKRRLGWELDGLASMNYILKIWGVKKF